MDYVDYTFYVIKETFENVFFMPINLDTKFKSRRKQTPRHSYNREVKCERERERERERVSVSNYESLMSYSTNSSHQE